MNGRIGILSTLFRSRPVSRKNNKYRPSHGCRVYFAIAPIYVINTSRQNLIKNNILHPRSASARNAHRNMIRAKSAVRREGCVLQALVSCCSWNAAHWRNVLISNRRSISHAIKKFIRMAWKMHYWGNMLFIIYLFCEKKSSPELN